MSKPAFTQPNDVGFWYTYYGLFEARTSWKWWTEVSYRNFNFIGDLESLVFRTAMMYPLTKNNNHIDIGIGYIYTTPYIPGTNEKIEISELRIDQTFWTKQWFGRFQILHRYRFEERIFKNNFLFRWRYFLRVLVGINKPDLKADLFYFVTSNEVFLRNRNPIFGQDRLYGGFGYFLTDQIQLEGGLEWRFIEEANRPQIVFTFLINKPYKEKK